MLCEQPVGKGHDTSAHHLRRLAQEDEHDSGDSNDGEEGAVPGPAVVVPAVGVVSPPGQPRVYGLLPTKVLLPAKPKQPNTVPPPPKPPKAVLQPNLPKQPITVPPKKLLLQRDAQRAAAVPPVASLGRLYTPVRKEEPAEAASRKRAKQQVEVPAEDPELMSWATSVAAQQPDKELIGWAIRKTQQAMCGHADPEVAEEVLQDWATHKQGQIASSASTGRKRPLDLRSSSSAPGPWASV